MAQHTTAVQRLDGMPPSPLQQEPPISLTQRSASTKGRIRVGAYCRVSTDLEAQKSSITLQTTVFRSLIEHHPGWELVDIYADEGFSGGSVRKRKEFQRMVQDSMHGKLDYIITKSISRFARNTLECLTYVRQLQTYGTQIYFEKENIDTGSAFSEMLLTILAAFAQEESRSLSENAKWGIRKRFEAGLEKRSRIFGYRFDADHHYLIEPAEAATVRRIFALYETGQYSMQAIARQLMAENRPSATCMRWDASHVHVILNNEKYVGDVLMQKKYTVDHMTHREVKNRDRVLPQFYIRDHHVPIIARKQFDRCQKIAWMKSRHGKSCQYPYNDLLVCPRCGNRMQQHAIAATPKRTAWHCDRDGGCGQMCLRGKQVDQAVLKAYEQVDMQALAALQAGPNAIAAQALLHMKAVHPHFSRVDFYWLDELVQHITFDGASGLTVHWRCGLTTSARMQMASPTLQKNTPPFTNCISPS